MHKEHLHNIHPSLSGVSFFLHSLLVQREKIPWSAETGFELGLAVLHAKALLNELRRTLN
jgi:hypothetical protein